MVESKRNRVRLVSAPSSALPRSPCANFEGCMGTQRINVHRLKSRILKRVGVHRANSYFLHLVRFLCSRVSKVELDRLVIGTIGRKNVPLHNQFVKAILINSINGRAPPPSLPSTIKHHKMCGSKYLSPSVTSYRPHTSPSTVSNGDSFLSSPRSVKSTARQYVDKDCRVSPLGHSEAHSTATYSLHMQQHEFAGHSETRSNSSLENRTKQAGPDCVASNGSVSVIESKVGPGGGDINFDIHESQEKFLLKNFIREPLGILSYRNNANSTKWPTLCAYPAHFLRQDVVQDDVLVSNILPHGDFMHSLVEWPAIQEGLEGASKDSVEVLSIALNVYLKRLIKSCVNECRVSDNMHNFQVSSSCDGNVKVVGARKVDQGMKEMPFQPLMSLAKMQQVQQLISLNSFKAAMDRNPQQLGPEWPVQLEKILVRVFNQ